MRLHGVQNSRWMRAVNRPITSVLAWTCAVVVVGMNAFLLVQQFVG